MPIYQLENDVFVSEGSNLNDSIYIFCSGISLINLESNKIYHQTESYPYLVGHFESLYAKAANKNIFSIKIAEDGYGYQINREAFQAFGRLFPREYQQVVGGSLDAMRSALVAKLLSATQVLTLSDYENKYKKQMQIKQKVEELKNRIRELWYKYSDK